MKRIIGICCLSLLTLGANARAQEKAAPAAAPPAGMPDMTKMGPMSKPVRKEAEDKKGVDELFKAVEAAWKKGDAEALAELVDFPVIMMSDDSAGNLGYF